MLHHRQSLFAAVVMAASALPSFAQAEDSPPAALPFTYEIFEQSVPHLDLAVCPAPLAGPERFCRFTAQSDGLNVFVFSEAGDQPLIGFQSWSADLLVGLMD